MSEPTIMAVTAVLAHWAAYGEGPTLGALSACFGVAHATCAAVRAGYLRGRRGTDKHERYALTQKAWAEL